MTHRGPVITAIVVMAGLVGFMTANSAGALADNEAGGDKGVEVPAPSDAAAQGSQAKPGDQGQAGNESGDEEDKEKAPEKPKEPPAPTFPSEVVYTGDATGNNLAIAVAVKGDQASGYLCDGSEVEDWMKGSAEGDTVEMTSKGGTSSLKGTLKGKRLVGTVEFHGQSAPFSIGVGEAPTGLYRGQNGQTLIGWIILPNGQQVGIANTAGAEAPAPKLDPDQGYVMVDGQRIDAQQIEGDTAWG